MFMAKKTPKRHSNKFPLTLHPTGQYCKKVRGRLYYFGKNKRDALERYLQQATLLHSGQIGRAGESYNGLQIKTLCNMYLDHQNSRVKSGEIKLGQVYDQTIALKNFVCFLGPNRVLSDVSTLDLQNYKSSLVKRKLSAGRINNHISAIKAMYHWAHHNEVISSIPNLAAIKKLPRSKNPKPIFSPDEIKQLIGSAEPQMQAMILLGLNCGFGCTDCAELQWNHLDLEVGRVNFPRTKTGVGRNLPLWNETIKALSQIQRNSNLVFCTKQGERLVRFIERHGIDGVLKLVKYDAISRDFILLLKRVGINKPKGVGFYTLRRTAATWAAQSGDPFAVQRLLGHADLKMATTYVQDINEQTDRVINNSRRFIARDSS